MRDIKGFHPRARQLISHISDSDIRGFVAHKWNNRDKLVFTVYLNDGTIIPIYSLYGKFSLEKK